jgi:hypothetical protein
MNRVYRIMALSLLLAVAVSAYAGPGKNFRGNFPLREADETTPFYPVYTVLKAGLEEDESKAFKAYLQLMPKDRTATPAKIEKIKGGEWMNLRTQAGAYLAHDTYGFKAYVLKMSPGKITKKTRKVYFTLRNEIEPEDRKGLIIVERAGRNSWKVRSLTL